MSAPKLTKDRKPTPQNYEDWNELETPERINHFLCGARHAGQSFLNMASCFEAVQHTKEQIPVLLKAQDSWCLKQKY